MHFTAKHSAGAAEASRAHPGIGRRQPAPRSVARAAALRDAGDWKQRAQEAYRQMVERSRAMLQLELADRVGALTHQAIDPAAVYVNDAERFAVVPVSGIVFRLRHHQLTILRACGACGTGAFQSPPIESLADLGFALTVWEPRCPHCDPHDNIDWQDEAAFN